MTDMTCCIIIDLSNIDWNALTAISTFILAVITFVTLRQNRSQLKEMKRQWEEENKPKKVIASDNKEGPLVGAKENIKKQLHYLYPYLFPNHTCLVFDKLVLFHTNIP